MSDVNPCINEDIWFQILNKLPVKSLGKCRCVCKSWRSLVVSPSFMSAHLKHYTQNKSNSLLLHKDYSECSKPGKYEQCVFYRDAAQLKEGHSSLHTSIFPFMAQDQRVARFRLLGSINGLLCLSDSANFARELSIVPRSTVPRILIWNPLLKKSIMLPESVADNKTSVLGFGYDCRKNDHRVVKLSARRGETLVEVYSVQERTWRESFSDYLVQNSLKRVSHTQCFFNGFIHWLTVEDEGGDEEQDDWLFFGNRVRPSRDSLPKWLLLFNVVDKTFDKIELPEASTKMKSGDIGVFEYQSQLSVSHCWCDSLDVVLTLNCEIWVRKECNLDSSWCKILYVESLNDCYHNGLVQYLGTNVELVGFAKSSTRELVMFDHETSQSRKTRGLGIFGSAATRFSAYSESLVLLDQTIDALTAQELERREDPILELLYQEEENNFWESLEEELADIDAEDIVN